ncbi:MAG: hypothetical protein CMH83_07855 [Nocardioides sp.]|nr:hypothetical protein [Nocardioides sp.]
MGGDGGGGRTALRVAKWLGVAGVAGVAASGVVVARNQRRRAQVTPDEVRDRLHARYAEAEGSDSGAGSDAGSASDSGD